MSWWFKVSLIAAPQNQWSNKHHRQEVWLPMQYQSPAQQPAWYHCLVLPCQALHLAPCQTGRYQQAFGSNCFQENYCKMTFSNSTSTNVYWPDFVLDTFTFDAQSKATSVCLVALAHVSGFIYTHNDGECISRIMILVRWCIIPGEVEPWECMQEINHVFDS